MQGGKSFKAIEGFVPAENYNEAFGPPPTPLPPESIAAQQYSYSNLPLEGTFCGLFSLFCPLA